METPKRIMVFENEVETMPYRDATDYAAYVNIPVRMETYLYLRAKNPDIKVSETLEDLIDYYSLMCEGGPRTTMPDDWHEFRMLREEKNYLLGQGELETE